MRWSKVEEPSCFKGFHEEQDEFGSCSTLHEENELEKRVAMQRELSQSEFKISRYKKNKKEWRTKSESTGHVESDLLPEVFAFGGRFYSTGRVNRDYKIFMQY